MHAQVVLLSHIWISYSFSRRVMMCKPWQVDFVWINRDQKSFEWFLNLLGELEAEQTQGGALSQRIVDMRLFMTAAASKTDIKGMGLQLAMDLLHETEKRDVITGLQTRTLSGRPDWDKVSESR